MLRAARSFQRTRRSRRPMQLRSFLPERRLTRAPGDGAFRVQTGTMYESDGAAQVRDRPSFGQLLAASTPGFGLRLLPGSARLDRSWSARQEEERSVPKHAVIGPQIVEAVDAKMADGAATRSQAFATVAKERGMSISSVSSHYYRATRAAREQGGGDAKTAPERRTTRAGPRKRTPRAASIDTPSSDDLGALVGAIVKDAEALGWALARVGVKELRSRLEHLRLRLP